ncbi:unnamed protein product [Amoebophrya sp. A120]|nr:unnamed protein product [Amoebophrya sp. A120]|eukprot:GSA120T00022514001.1
MKISARNIKRFNCSWKKGQRRSSLLQRWFIFLRVAQFLVRSTFGAMSGAGREEDHRGVEGARQHGVKKTKPLFRTPTPCLRTGSGDLEYGINPLESALDGSRVFKHHEIFCHFPPFVAPANRTILYEFSGLKVPVRFDCANQRQWHVWGTFDLGVKAYRTSDGVLLTEQQARSRHFENFRDVPGLTNMFASGDSTTSSLTFAEMFPPYTYYAQSMDRRYQCHVHAAMLQAFMPVYQVPLPVMDEEYDEHVQVYQSVWEYWKSHADGIIRTTKVWNYKNGRFRRGKDVESKSLQNPKPVPASSASTAAAKPVPHRPFVFVEAGGRWGTWGFRALQALRQFALTQDDQAPAGGGGWTTDERTRSEAVVPANKIPYHITDKNAFLHFFEMNPIFCDGIREMARVNHFPLSTHRLRIYCRPFNLELFGSILADRRHTPVIDVLDMDIQGGESILSDVDKTYPLLWDLMCTKVKKVIIGTHNKFTHEAIVETFLGRKRKSYEVGAPAAPVWELVAEMPHRHAVQANSTFSNWNFTMVAKAMARERRRNTGSYIAGGETETSREDEEQFGMIANQDGELVFRNLNLIGK